MHFPSHSPLSADSPSELRQAGFPANPSFARLAAVATSIEERISQSGYAVLPAGTVTVDEYRTLGQLLGTVIEEDDIRVHGGGDVLAYSDRAILFHNDGPEGAIIALHCISAGTAPVGTWIVDVRDLRTSLAAEVLDYLQGCRFTRAKGRGNLEREFSVLTLTPDDGFVLYYVPWYHPAPQTAQQSNLYDKFTQYLASRAQSTGFNITLREGETLFLDNHHFLHGREKLERASPRWLKRLWIDPTRTIEPLTE